MQRLPYLRPCDASDDVFLYQLFGTTWENEVAALPNQNLVQHVLRIQHIAQERRFAQRYPGHDRYVVLAEGQSAGRLYVYVDDTTMHVVDVTVMPRFRSRGIATRLLRDLCELASQEQLKVSLRVARKDVASTGLVMSLGFRLVAMDDLEGSFEWTTSARVNA